MNFTITRQNLHNGLAAVSASIPSKTTLPVLSNILFDASDDGVWMSGTDLDVAVRVRVPADIKEPGTLTAPGKKLQEITRELPDQPVEVATRGDQIELSVVAHDGQESSEPLRSAPFTVANSAPQITSTPGAFDEDGTFRYAVLADDPDGDRALRYQLVAGPDGMRIDVVTGELTWTPMPDQAGSHPVAIEVGDRKGGISAQSFDIRVQFEEVTTPAAPAAPET